MEEKRKNIDKLILAYLVGGLDDETSKGLERWISASPENEAYFTRRQDVYLAAIRAKGNAVYNKDKAFEQFQSRVAKAKETVAEADVRNRFRLSVLWRYAAVVAVLCVVSYFSYWRGGEKMKGHFAEIVVEAPLGSRTKLNLPDGTLVWLNGGSKMSYSQGFGVADRSVRMTGEGYFEVKRNEKLPFIVQTKNLSVRVLGTKFNFRDYAEDDEVVVSLLAGKVALNNLMKDEKEISLVPNERVVLDKKSGKMQLERTVATNAAEWTKGYLFFDEELLPDIVKELERSYNVKIKIKDDTLNTFRFYGNFVRREQSIDEVLDALAATGKIRYKIEGNEITLY